MTALSFRCEARSRIASNSAFCSAVVSPFREGQSMLTTVAIQAARNSRIGAGGLIEVSWYVALQALAAGVKVARKDNALVRRAVENNAMTTFCFRRARRGKN